jgi:hypothetical protein
MRMPDVGTNVSFSNSAINSWSGSPKPIADIEPVLNARRDLATLDLCEHVWNMRQLWKPVKSVKRWMPGG